MIDDAHTFYTSLKNAIILAQNEGILKVIEIAEDYIVVNYLIELPQYPICEIKSIEPVKFIFEKQSQIPIPYFLRDDFPNLPHLIVGSGRNKAPCLVQSDFEHFALNWNAEFYVKRVYEWLYYSARGTLHQRDQHLELFMLMTKGNLIRNVETYFQNDNSFFLEMKDFKYSKSYYLKNSGSPDEEVVLLNYEELIYEHKGLQAVPTNLKELNELFSTLGNESFYSDLKAALTQNNYRKQLLIQIKVQVNDGNLDRTDYQSYAFLFSEKIEIIGNVLGLLAKHDGIYLPLIGTAISDDSNFEDVLILSLSINDHFNQSIGRISNGKTHSDIFPTATQIGVGAIGFGIAECLTRTGFFGKLFAVDYDVFLPHNTSRWLLSDNYGLPKVEILAEALNRVFTTAFRRNKVENYCDPIFEKISLSQIPENIMNALEDSHLIIDCSASTVVQKTLDHIIHNKSERFTFFCSPNGENLIAFYTQNGSKYTHTVLELSLYKRMVHNIELETLFEGVDKGFTYGGDSCRSISHILSSHDLSIASSISANLIEELFGSKSDFVGVWRKSSLSNYNLDVIEIEEYQEYKHIEDTLINFFFSRELLTALNKLRKENLPNETGSSLIGHFDIVSNSMYIVDCISTPSDSEKSPVSFQRGIKGNKTIIDNIAKVTHGNLYYIGEWHSHPVGCAPTPSKDDLKQLEWLRNESFALHFPYIMLILSDSDFTINI